MHHGADISKDRLRVDDLAPTFANLALGLGIVGLATSAGMLLILRGGESFFRGYLTAFVFCLSLALGGLFFTLLQHLTRAGWSVVVRRIAENLAGVLPVLAVLSLPIVVPVVLGWPNSIKDVYPWRDLEAIHQNHDHILEHKQPYLNPTFFAIRMFGYFAIWWWLSSYFRNNSLRQDETGDASLTSAMQTRSAPGMLLFALTLTFCAIDLLMTLNPYWFSTIFGVYYFAGANVGFYAMLAVVMVFLQRAGRGQHAYSIEHFHDVGKLMFAFTIFWAYIGFSQYMLIWYANLPEETTFYVVRQEGNWKYFSLFLLFGHFAAPFLALISRWPKRDPNTLIAGAAWMLIIHYCDMFWLVFPHEEGAKMVGPPEQHALIASTVAWLDIAQCAACLLGVGGVFLWAFARNMAQGSIVPMRDPRLSESLAFENI